MCTDNNEIMFHPISLEDQGWMQEKLQEECFHACEYTFVNNFIWRKVYQVEVAEIMGCGIIRYSQQGECQYSFPFGNGNKQEVIRLLMEKCAECGHKFSMYPVEEKERKLLSKWFHGRFELESNRDDFDYVYTVEKLSNLKGRKLSGKRNHIARFKDEDDWHYEPMNSGNIDACRQMARTWIELREDKWNQEMEQEMGVLEEAFSHFDELSLVGGVLYKQDHVVAFAIGEPLNPKTMVVHFEKAYPDLQGAYPMMNQQFVLHECQHAAYVNREEDTGDMGLRRAKLSYYPDILLKKYIATESHVVFADESDTDQIQELWRTCFGDEEAYIDLYLKNRFEIENMMVIHEDGQLVSMASFLPAEITMNGEKCKARYVYAVATLPEYRKRGYASELIHHASEKYGQPLILQVENNSVSLAKFYEGLGFRKGFLNETRQLKTDCAKKTDTDMMQMQELTPAEYKRIRDAYFGGEGYVEWDEDAIAYALQENAFCNGKALRICFSENDQEALLLYRVEDDKIRIMETTLSEERLLEILPLLLEEAGKPEAYTQNNGGMILLPEEMSWNAQRGYLNLTLA